MTYGGFHELRAAERQVDATNQRNIGGGRRAALHL
jgi:hypothetical protein